MELLRGDYLIIIINLISMIFYVFEMLIFARCILSFFPVYNKLTQWVFMATEPVLSPCRRLIDRFLNVSLPIDFSPVLAILIMQFLQRIILTILVNFL